MKTKANLMFHQLKVVISLRASTYGNALLGLVVALLAGPTQASILAPGLCNAFKSLFDNELYAFLGMIALVIAGISMVMDEGNSKVKTYMLRIVVVVLALVNVGTISNLIFGQPTGC